MQEPDVFQQIDPRLVALCYLQTHKLLQLANEDSRSAVNELMAAYCEPGIDDEAKQCAIRTVACELSEMS